MARIVVYLASGAKIELRHCEIDAKQIAARIADGATILLATGPSGPSAFLSTAAVEAMLVLPDEEIKDAVDGPA